MSADSPLLDTLRPVETPEGIHLELPLAGPVVRALAFAIDLFIRLGLIAVLGFLLSYLGRAGIGFTYLAFFLLEWFYPVVFELTNRGATPGKQLLKLQVIHDNGTPVNLGSSLVRNLLRAADFLPLAYGFGLVAMAVNRDFKRLGDLAAGTVVCYRPNLERLSALPPGPSRPPPFSLTPNEQQLLISYAERSADLSEDRSRELAAVLEEHNLDRDAIMAHARWLAGSQTDAYPGKLR
ncbi:MAG: RDD family protein [Candidatus Competibacterales bacterium]